MPDVIKALEGRIKDWKNYKGIVMITPKSLSLDKIYFFRRYLQLSYDRKSIFIGRVSIPTDMLSFSEIKDLYMKLKGMECEFEKGFLWRKPQFKTRLVLLELKKRLPDLNMDETLINELNRDETLLRLVKSIQPETLTIQLSAAPEPIILKSFESPLLSIEDFYDAEISYCKNPGRIEWEITLTRILERGFSYKKIVNRILDTFEQISQKLRTISADKGSTLDQQA